MVLTFLVVDPQCINVNCEIINILDKKPINYSISTEVKRTKQRLFRFYSTFLFDTFLISSLYFFLIMKLYLLERKNDLQNPIFWFVF